MEAWPEEPELVEETEMRGRCENGAEGGRKMEASSVGLVSTQDGAVDQAAARSSGRDSDLISGVGVVAVGVEADEVLAVAELEVEEVAEGDKRPVEAMEEGTEADGACIGGGASVGVE
jgi:hypothetical protein